MRINLNQQEFFGVCALVIQYMTENEKQVEDENLQDVVKKAKGILKAPLRTFFLSNPDLRLIMKRMLPTLTGEAQGNLHLEIISSIGDKPDQKSARVKAITKKLLNGFDLQGGDLEYLCEHHNITSGVEYKPPEYKGDNLPFKYIGGPCK